HCQHLPRRVPPERHAGEASVAAAATPAGTIGLEHDGANPVIAGEVVRTRQSRIAAPDDRDLGFRLWRGGAVVLRGRPGRSGPIRPRIVEPFAGAGSDEGVVSHG